MKKHLLLFFCFCGLIFQIQAQEKKVMEHTDYASWNQIQRPLISNDGKFVAYVVQPGEGNPQLNLYNNSTKGTLVFERSNKPQFSVDNRYLVFNTVPDADQVKEMKRKGKSKMDLPGDTLVIYDINEAKTIKVDNASNIQLPAKWTDWLFYIQERTIEADSTTKKIKELVAWSLPEETAYPLLDGSAFKLASEKAAAIATTKEKKAKKEAGIYFFDATEKSWKSIHEEEGTYRQLSIDEEGGQVAFLANFDTVESRIEAFDLYYWNKNKAELDKAISRDHEFLPSSWLISSNGTLSFSENGQKLFFGIAPQPVLKDTSLLPEEEVSVEVWSYTDKVLYTQQEVMKPREERRTYQCVFFPEEKRVRQIASLELPNVRLADEGNGDYAVAYTDRPYLEKLSWEGGPTEKDIYLIEVASGKKEKIATALKGSPAMSPAGKFIYWYNSADTAWFAYNIAKKELHQLTNNGKVPFYDELNDRPMLPSSYGLAGWTKDDDFLMIYDRYDIWLVDPAKELAHNNLTNGRKDKTISRYVWLDREERSIEEVEPMLLHFVNEENKKQGYYWFNIHTGVKKMVQEGDFAYTRRPQKAKNANAWLFTKESYELYPDLYYGTNNLEQASKISEVNPQQKDYNWGSIEIFEWTSNDGQALKGLLVKPENFDPTKKYPMIVNFYERSSQGLHRHRTPTPGRSTINYPFYASRGYLIFNPDVPYKIGYPGESAYDAVVSGTAALIKEGFVDKDNIGLQGHSWGGYQIAHIITKTDMFKCAESGAPVVNMISAYGGIRWGSGMSRMFQYERTQSRIGATIWEKPLRYIENSPIFFMDKVNTPVLILHNDEDTAVPWYQGIEFFVALRRLGKPAWLLNYNGEPHWPLKLQNRKDFQLRMSQFFDHYLQGASMPVWMAEGVPATEKGINQRLELMDKH